MFVDFQWKEETRDERNLWTQVNNFLMIGICIREKNLRKNGGIINTDLITLKALA